MIAPYAVAWRDGVLPGASDVVLNVPNPVNLTAPQSDAPVTPSTLYSWSSLGQTARTFVWRVEFRDTFEGMLVITSRTQIELPTFPDGFTVPAGTPYSWSVETHGDAPSVDAPGAVCNNMRAIARPGSYADVAPKLDFIRSYKFTIAFENESARGYTTEEIAEQIYRSVPTAALHLKNAAQKLGARNRAQAVARAAHYHLLDDAC